MVDTVRGRLRVRKWPRKRGTPKSPLVRQWNDWFRDANYLAKRAPGHAQNAAIELTKGTGLYPRDLMLRAMSKGLIDIAELDDRLIQNRERRLEKMSFNGAILRLAANQSIAANVETAPNWGLPELDTFGFWNAGSPTLLTIPAGVEIVNCFAGGSLVSSTTQRFFGTFRVNGTPLRGYLNVTATGSQGVDLSTGPLIVSEGDTIEAKFRSAINDALIGDGRTFFSLQVLQTTV